NHVSFEVPDVDAVFKDHEYLTRLGKYDHMWGVGRHLLGSQVYDYWADPWGRVHERWADTDRLNARSGSNLLPGHEALGSQGGGAPPREVQQANLAVVRTFILPAPRPGQALWASRPIARRPSKQPA